MINPKLRNVPEFEWSDEDLERERRKFSKAVREYDCSINTYQLARIEGEIEQRSRASEVDIVR